MGKLQAIILGALAALTLGAALAALPDSEPVASVNGQNITAGDLKHYMALQPEPPRPPAGSPMTQAELNAAATRQALDGLIERQLLLQPARDSFGEGEAAKAALDAFAERELRKLEDRAGSRMRARQVLSEKGITVEQYKQFQIDSALIMRMMWDKVFAGVAVKPAELRDYYDAHREEFRRPRMLLYRQILFTVPDPQQEAARRAQAQDVLKQLKDGADFGQLADRNSADGDKYPGGLHLVPLTEDHADWRPAALEGLAAGQISEVRKVGESLCIARLEGIEEPRLLTFAEAQDAIRGGLLERKRSDAQAACVEGLKRKARIQYLAGAEELGVQAPGSAR